jgi:hypothetical protein
MLLGSGMNEPVLKIESLSVLTSVPCAIGFAGATC